MEQSKFHSASGLDNHDNSCCNDSMLESNAFISSGSTTASGRSGRKAYNISSCDSMNLGPISRLNVNQTDTSRRRRRMENQNQRQGKSKHTDEDTSNMKIRKSKQSKKSNGAKKRPHFRIDWRQLSYYQRPHSFLSKCLASLDVFSPSNSKTVDQQMRKRMQSSTTDDGAGAINERSEVSSLVLPVGETDDITRDDGEPRQILNSLDGYFKSGELSAILGPSGAGKSTFLSTLFGAKQESAFGYTKVTWLNDSTAPGATKTSGADDDNSLVTTVNNSADQMNDNGDDEQQRSLRIAFLPQHDHLLHHLTVYETLMFASKIKNHERQQEEITSPTKGGAEKRRNFHHFNVKRVAKMLKLTECLNTRCGKLSGGQYKRVSIGQELLSEPDVIILDEPTSGLDAMTCLTTIQTLKSIVTKHPMSIILTIHQPDNDVFSLFDKVYVIAQGGLAIYEGPPEGIFPALAEVNLIPPRANYNPARFIVENAFVPEHGAQDHLIELEMTKPVNDSATLDSSSSSSSSSLSSSDDDDDEDSSLDDCKTDKGDKNYFKRSVQSLTDTIMGKETPFVRSSPFSNRENNNTRDTIRRPLLNIGGIRTLDGQLITSEQLVCLKEKETFSQQQQERIALLKRLNQMQKAKYERPIGNSINDDALLSSKSTQTTQNSPTVSSPSPSPNQESSSGESRDSKSTSAKSDYSSASACSMMMISERQQAGKLPEPEAKCKPSARATKSVSLVCLPPASQSSPRTSDNEGSVASIKRRPKVSNSLGSGTAGLLHIDTTTITCVEPKSKTGEFVVDFGADIGYDHHLNVLAPSSSGRKMRRKFDKRLSAKHNCSQQTGYPILYHALLLTHRTWLSIVRDPVFFGIQACMHTLIPLVLALIFGSVQEEGCPRIGNFDLVDFAYSDSENLIQGTVRSIRQSIGNIGIVFFEMFVICFAINCITALVFPLDMFVLLKEYRNGWYSLRSYFMGRTLADLPVPVVLHSIGMAILYFMTGQPHSLWRFSLIVVLVILASLVAQSVGLTIGALLMKSSQSAVLAAAGIVAPFFALSGFIVRIHTLPAVAQLASQGSYLYHLLNGFIILRYGFQRCPCSDEDFEQNSGHQIPNNLHTMASMWIGTYSDEYSNSSSVLAAAASQLGHNRNRSNVDPNIDVVDKMMNAFKMANSYGHQIEDCADVLPYAMLDFNLRDQDIYYSFFALAVMLLVTRLITFSAIYYKIRSFA